MGTKPTRTIDHLLRICAECALAYRVRPKRPAYCMSDPPCGIWRDLEWYRSHRPRVPLPGVR